MLVLFCYFRLKPIQYQTVPYTYDQGRDFLKAQEIIRDKNLTFIGPTTGITGVYHGAWWFYLLVVPFVLSAGNPIAFYYFVFFLALLQTVLFTYFLHREFNTLTAAFFALLIATAPYFISTSFFSSNSILALPFILLLFYATYSFLKSKKNVFLFLIFLSLSFIFESELAFGIFIIPSYVIAIILSKQLRLFLGNWTKKKMVFLGLLIPVIPRIFFELKHHFSQTFRIGYSFLNPTATNPVSLKGAFFDRGAIFLDYYKGLFFQHNQFITLGVSFIICVGALLLLFKSKKTYKQFTYFILTLFVILFGITLTYHKNFFWSNYLEGLSYFYLLFISMAVYVISQSKQKVLAVSVWVVMISLMWMGGSAVYADFKANKKPADVGLRANELIVNHIYDVEKNNDYCLIIYTPPVIPHTYNYLLDYRSHKLNKNRPLSTYINNSCWFIVDNDDNIERRQKWIDENVPSKGEKLYQYTVTDFATVFKLITK